MRFEVAKATKKRKLNKNSNIDSNQIKKKKLITEKKIQTSVK
jgi:hypothetical protein